MPAAADAVTAAARRVARPRNKRYADVLAAAASPGARLSRRCMCATRTVVAGPSSARVLASLSHY
eukprot:scaffold9049_cov105-Isochrysis_galbana.AAC.1